MDWIRSAKDRLVRGLINEVIIAGATALILWLLRYYRDAISTPTDFISNNSGINWWLVFFLVSLMLFVIAYLIGNFSLIDLIKWRSKKKISDQKEFFSIRLKNAGAAGFAKEFDGHIEGYVTKSYMTPEGTRYNAAIFISGWTVLSRLREDEFIRTNKSIPQLVAYYMSAGREYVDDRE